MDKLFIACSQCQSINRVPWDRRGQKGKCGSCQTQLPNHNALQDQNVNGLAALIAAAGRPLVVDFWAPWCGPCLSFAPNFAAASEQLGQTMDFVKVNTEAHPHAGAQHGVRGIPTLVFFDQGREIRRISGALPLQQLLAWLQGK